MNKLKTNYLYSVLYQVLNICLPLVTAPYLSRVLGAEKSGVYSFTFSIVSYFMLIAMLGLNNYGNRTIATVQDDKSTLSRTFFSIYWMQLFNAIIVIIAYVVYITVFASEYININIYWLIYLFSAAFDISWFFFGIEQFRITVTRNAIVKLVSVVLILLFVKSETDLWVYTLITALTVLSNQLLLWFFLRRYVSLEKVLLSDVFKHIKPNFILFTPVIAISIYTIMGKILIGNFSSMVEVGLFENAQKIITLPIGLITALGTVMLPRMSNMLSRGEFNKVNDIISLSMQFTIILSSLMAFGIAGIAPVLAPVFLGKEFAPSSILMTLLSVTVIFIAWANVIRTQYLIPTKNDKSYVISVVLGAIVNLIINMILIPKYGAKGAAFGTIMAECTVAVYQTITVKHRLEISKYLRNGIVYLLIGLIMCLMLRVVGFYMGTSIVTLLVQLCVGGVFYIICSAFIVIKLNNPLGQVLKSKLNKNYGLRKLNN